MQDDSLPRQFGPYLLFDEIGAGGMAKLYLGHTKTGLGGERLVVVKQVLPMLADNEDFCRLLTQEAKLAAKLTHKNVASVVDLGREGETLYIAMEYVEGFDLRDLLRECSKKRLPLPVQFALLLVMEVLTGLDYAHKKTDDDGNALGIVHRDVSPSNILISFDGEVKLCDFGIALALGAEAKVPEAGVQGKAGYMSPEAAVGGAIDGRSDVFCAGIILWELLNGRRMYKGIDKAPPSIDQAAAAEIPPLKTRGYTREAELHRIVLKALAKEPEERYASAGEMRGDLQQYVRDSGLFSSPLKFGDWLTQHFADEILERRRVREVAARTIANARPEPRAVERASARAEAPEAPTSRPIPKSRPSGVRAHAIRATVPSDVDFGALKRREKPALLLAVAALAVVLAALLLSL